jgi:site-specific recombinase XerD
MKSLSLKRATNGYLLAKQAEGLSPNTINWYRHFLDAFAKWLPRVTKDDAISGLNADYLREFLRYLKEPHALNENHRFKRSEVKSSSPKTVSGAFATLSGFFNWCCAEKLLSASPMTNMKRPKVPKTLTAIFPREDMQAMLDACDASDEATATRNRVILMLLLDTGMRRSELVGLKIDRLSLNESNAHITGKGSKDRVVPFGAQTKKMLWRYISLYRPTPVDNAPGVFLNFDGSAMKPRMINEIIDRVACRVKIRQTLSSSALTPYPTSCFIKRHCAEA